MRTNRLGYVSTLVAVFFLLCSACNGCGKQPEFCKGLELAADEGQPLDEIEVILDLPEEEEEEGSSILGDVIADSVGGDEDAEEPAAIGNMVAEVHAKGLDDPYWAPIKQDEETGRYFLTVPPHPDGIDGGKVKLRIINEEGECRGKKKFEILPLEKAPGTLDAMIDKIERIAELEATEFGFTLEDLREDTFEELPTPLWGPSRAVWGVNGPENDNSLQKLVDGDADADISEGIEFAEALLAKAGQLESLDRVIEELEAVEDPEFDIEFAPQAIVSPSALPARTRRSALSCEDLVLSPVLGRDVRQLSYYMSLAAAATQELEDGTADKVDLVATILGVIPHPAVKAAGVAMGLAAFYRKSTTQIYANTLPSRLVNPELYVNREWFEEDSEEQGSWNPNDGVRGYEVSAESNGIDLTATMVVGLINALDAVMGVKGINDDAVKDSMELLLDNWQVAKDIGQTSATEFTKAKAGDLEGRVPSRRRGGDRST